jgi:hypothetical protein
MIPINSLATFFGTCGFAQRLHISYQLRLSAVHVHTQIALAHRTLFTCAGDIVLGMVFCVAIVFAGLGLVMAFISLSDPGTLCRAGGQPTSDK